MSRNDANSVRIGDAESSNISQYSVSVVKRSLDVLLGCLLLLVFAPVLLATILVNFLFTRGHPIFVQRRAGKDGTEFDLYKLRTMRRPVDGERWAHRTDQNDGRVTRFGRLLRVTYLDELPQLVNVVMGQMSIIGPRPETIETTLEIAEQQPRFTERLSVRPGISGTAQVFFRKPESDNDLWLRYYYDHHYVMNASLKLDLLLIVLTVWHIVRYKGH